MSGTEASTQPTQLALSASGRYRDVDLHGHDFSFFLAIPLRSDHPGFWLNAGIVSATRRNLVLVAHIFLSLLAINMVVGTSGITNHASLVRKE